MLFYLFFSPRLLLLTTSKQRLIWCFAEFFVEYWGVCGKNGGGAKGGGIRSPVGPRPGRKGLQRSGFGGMKGGKAPGLKRGVKGGGVGPGGKNGGGAGGKSGGGAEGKKGGGVGGKGGGTPGKCGGYVSVGEVTGGGADAGAGAGAGADAGADTDRSCVRVRFGAEAFAAAGLSSPP